MPSWRELKRFCQADGWKLTRDTDHYYYEKELPDGKIKKTRVSKGTGEIKGGQWQRILKKQLQVSLEYFNKIK